MKNRNALPAGYRLNWYLIERVLGQGGFGITYLAKDENLDELVAIKEYLPIELAVREGDHSVHPVSQDHDGHYGWGLKRFIDEARTITRLRHEALVRVRAVFEANNTAYMVMDYEAGQSLEALLKGRGTLTEGRLRAMLEPLLQGVQEIHEAGFIHRDIKPANIYIRANDTPVLLDFGSARQALFGETKTLTAMVTPGYAPFEQYHARGDKQGPWTDIYGLGSTLYRAVCGVAPLDAIERSEGALSGGDGFIPARSIAGDAYSKNFLSAIDAALGFKPRERPQSIAQWREIFDDASAFDMVFDEDILAGSEATTIAELRSPAQDPQKSKLAWLRAIFVRHWKSKLGFGVLASAVLQNPIGFVIAMAVFHYVTPTRKIWIGITVFLVALILLAIGIEANKTPGAVAPG